MASQDAFTVNSTAKMEKHRVDRSIVAYLILMTTAFFVYARVAFSQILYNANGWLDPYIYVAYGLRYQYASYWNDYYKISRLPWIFIQFIFRQSFWPGPASFLIQVSCFSLMAASIYVGFRILFGRKPALFAAVASVFLPFFHASGGADYHNTLAGPLFFLTLALLMISLQRSNFWFAVAAGAIASATIHTNPLFIWTTPSVLLPALVYWKTRGRPWSHLIWILLAGLAGLVAMTILLGAINHAMGRRFLFFVPQLRFVLEVGRENHWWAPVTWETLRQSKQTGFLAAIFGISALELCRFAWKARWSEVGERAAVHIGYCITLLLGVLLQVRGQTILQPEYMAYQYVAATLLPLAAIVASTHSTNFPRLDWAVSLILAPVLFAILLSDSGEVAAAVGGRMSSAFALVVVATLVFYTINLIRSLSASLAIPLLIWAILNAILAYSGSYRYDPCETAAHLNQLMTTVTRISDGLTGNPDGTFIWFDKEDKFDPNNACYRDVSFLQFAVSSSEIVGSALGGIFPVIAFDQVTEQQIAQASKPASIVVLMSVSELVQVRFKEVAARHGLNANPLMRYLDRVTGIKFDFFSLRVAGK